jgi:hypothetical protein
MRTSYFKPITINFDLKGRVGSGETIKQWRIGILEGLKRGGKSLDIGVLTYGWSGRRRHGFMENGRNPSGGQPDRKVAFS